MEEKCIYYWRTKESGNCVIFNGEIEDSVCDNCKYKSARTVKPDKVLALADALCSETQCFKCKLRLICKAYNLSPQDVIDYLTEINQAL